MIGESLHASLHPDIIVVDESRTVKLGEAGREYQ